MERCILDGEFLDSERLRITSLLKKFIPDGTSNPWRFCKVSDSHFFAHRITWDQSSFLGTTLEEVLTKIKEYYG